MKTTLEDLKNRFHEIKQLARWNPNCRNDREELADLAIDIDDNMQSCAKLRDDARAEFESMPNGEVNGMIAKAEKKDEADVLGLLYTQHWRLLMYVRKHIETVTQTHRPKPIDRRVGHGFIDLYTDGAGNCFTDAGDGL